MMKSSCLVWAWAGLIEFDMTLNSGPKCVFQQPSPKEKMQRTCCL